MKEENQDSLHTLRLKSAQHLILIRDDERVSWNVAIAAIVLRFLLFLFNDSPTD